MHVVKYRDLLIAMWYESGNFCGHIKTYISNEAAKKINLAKLKTKPEDLLRYFLNYLLNEIIT